MFASCERSFIEQKNVYTALSNKDCNVIFLYSQDKIVQFPNTETIQNFSFDCNFEVSEKDFKYEFLSISTYLPFIPDVVLISRESWQPETSIIDEFKRYGSIICCLENTSWLHNNIKTRLEIISRFRYPTNAIDVFFDHSEWCLKTKELAGWVKNKTVITGNPKFDNMINLESSDNHEYVIVYGSMEINRRNNILRILQELKSNNVGNKYKVCYKPHPKEFEDFKDSFGNDIFDHVIIINTESELIEYVKKSSYNIGIFNSMLMYPLLTNKKILYIDDDDSGIMDDFNFEKFIGHEYEFWKRIINVNSFEEFKEKVGEQRVINFLKRYNEFVDHFKSCTKKYSIENLNSDDSTQNLADLIRYFDQYNDGMSSERIANYILDMFN